MVGVGVWVLVRWLTYILMAMATVWRGRDVEDAPSRRSGGQVRSGRVKPGVESSRVPSEYRIGPVRSGPARPARSKLRSDGRVVRRQIEWTSPRVDPSRRTRRAITQSHQHHIEWVRCASHASVRRVAKGERRQDGEGASAQAARERGAAEAALGRGSAGLGTEGEGGCSLVRL